MKKEFTVLSPTAILGYGFPEDSFYKGLDASPDLIAVDGGSTDPGPHYLGAGKSFTDRTGVKRDLRYMITEGVKRGIPVVVGTSGGCGARPHLDWCREIVEEIALENDLSFKLGLIYSDVEKEIVREALNGGKITPLDYVHELTEEILDESVNIVAQIGVEPMIDALKQGCDVILAGRAYDPACFAALPILQGYDEGLATHMGKILECAAIASTPGSGSDCVLGFLGEDYFRLETLSDERRFTKESTAAHTLYEKSDPYHLVGPGGSLNLENCEFIEGKERGVTVKGSRFETAEKYTVKLEASRKIGHRTISIAGTRDSILINQIDSVIEKVRLRVDDLLKKEKMNGNVHFHVYGKNGVMGSLEPEADLISHEICIIIDVVAPEQTMADTICSMTRSTLLHYGYDGRISTAGNLAFPFSPSDIKAGEVYNFSIYHIMEIDNQDMFKIEVKEI
ncbi:MAG: DUF1446 domain-containing protein [bacterium]|nr:DUF1446 domain-containing protein [bacterium]